MAASGFGILSVLSLLAFIGLRHCLTQIVHPFTQALHRFGLTVDSLSQIILAQRVLCLLHGAPRPFKCVSCGFARLAAHLRQALGLAGKLISQRLLALGKRLFLSLAFLSPALALALFFA